MRPEDPPLQPGREHTEPLRTRLSALRASTEAVCMNLWLTFRVLALGASQCGYDWTSDF